MMFRIFLNEKSFQHLKESVSAGFPEAAMSMTLVNMENMTAHVKSDNSRNSHFRYMTYVGALSFLAGLVTGFVALLVFG